MAKYPKQSASNYKAIFSSYFSGKHTAHYKIVQRELSSSNLSPERKQQYITIKQVIESQTATIKSVLASLPETTQGIIRTLYGPDSVTSNTLANQYGLVQGDMNKLVGGFTNAYYKEGGDPRTPKDLLHPLDVLTKLGL